MSINGTQGFGLESIKKQDGSFFEELTNAVAMFRKKADFSDEALKKSTISQIIKKHTNISVILRTTNSDEFFTVCPTLVPAHALSMGVVHQGTAVDVTGYAKKELVGKIDPENSKVYGLFAETECPIAIGIKAFKPGYLTDEEIAAFILHEVGHLFVYFQYLSTISYGAAVIGKTTQAFYSSDSFQERVVILKNAQEDLGYLDGSRIEDLAATPKEGIEVILLAKYFTNLGNKSIVSAYDYRNTEQLADIFAIRQGAGVYLSSGMDKIHRLYGDYGASSFVANMLTETGKFLNSLVRNKGFLAFLLTMPRAERYDNPIDRIQFIKIQLIEDLKNIPKGDNETRKQLTDSIKLVEETIKDVDYRRDVVRFFHECISIKGKTMQKQKEQQKRLEEFLNNDLYYKSAQFKLLTKD